MSADLPTIDHQLHSVCVPRTLMPSLLAMRTGASPHRTAITRLATGGLVSSGRLDPMVTDLLEVMTEPSLVASVEAETPDGHHLVTFWRQATRAVAGTTDAWNRFHISRVEVGLLPFALAQAVGLSPLHRPNFTGPITLPYSAFEAATDLAGSELSAAAQTLAAAGLDPGGADRLLAAMLLRRSRWSIESVSCDVGRNHISLSVLDGGHAGLWRLKPARSTDIEVSPIGFEALLEMLATMIR